MASATVKTAKNKTGKPAAPRRRRRSLTGNLFAKALDVPLELTGVLLRRLHLVRQMDDKLLEMGAPAAACPRGSEAILVGSCAALRAHDHIAALEPLHGFALARGVEPQALFAELGGNAPAPAPAESSPANFSILLLGSTAENAALAVGAALACLAEKKNHLVACFLNDATAVSGGVHEALHLAALWKLPIVFICEHRVGVQNPGHRVPLYTQAENLGIEALRCDGVNVLEVREVVAGACTGARAGKGPALIEAKIGLTPLAATGTGKNAKNAREIADPIGQFRVRLLEAEALTTEAAAKCEQAVRKEIAAACKIRAKGL